MNRIFATLLVVIILLGVIFVAAKKPKESPAPETADIVGCYVFKSDKNVYTLNIEEQTDSIVSGTMHFDNFQFDSSSGTFNGNFGNDILIGDYAFTSEGMDSVRQLIWKRSGNDFVQGSGDYMSIDGHEIFASPSAVTWDQNRIFTKSPCI